jgi:hypothetical protein
VKTYAPSPQEAAATAAHLERRRARIRAPRLKVNGVKDGVIQVEPDHPDHTAWQVAIEQAFGTVDYHCADLLMSAAVATVWPDPAERPDPRAINGMLATLHGISPRDEVEAMLASQMVATHLAAMNCLRRAQASGQTFEGRDMNLRHATKLTRTYAVQVEALGRYRGKGQQRVTVEHVHVHPGGQAIVGAVTTGGRGAVSKMEERAHGQPLAHAPEPAMPCPDPSGNAVPVTGREGAEAVPVPRRS